MRSSSLALCLGLLLRPALAAERQNNPTPDNFLRRAYSAVTILNNWIYIDGGEVSQIVDGKRLGPENSTRASKVLTATLAIDLSTSWLASDVKILEIERPDNKNDAPPPMDIGAIWNDASGQSFYVWGGIAPYGEGVDRIASSGVWKFTPDSNDRSTGAWSLETVSNPAVLSNTRKSFQGGFVTVPKTNTGYWLGGYAQVGRTEDPSSKGADGEAAGLMSFNMATSEWKNDTASDLVPAGRSRGAAGVWLPRFGANGLVTFVGGFGVVSGFREFTNLTFFDPVTRKSYSQTATGDAPSPRKDFCAVAVESPRGGHEVFVFGGANPQDRTDEAYDDVYVLTLPGFQWFKVDDTFGGPRSSHSCVVAGQRQMISIGGTSSNNFNNRGTTWDEPDKFGQGIGIFDMTALTWSTKGEYDAYAKKYASPDVVNEWYQTTGDLSKRQWSSSEVQALFVKDDTTKPTDGDSQNDNDNTTSGSESSSSSTGAIVGGVVGGVAVLLVAGLVWFFIRRRNRSAAAAKDSMSSLEHNNSLSPAGQTSLPQHYHEAHSETMSPRSGMQESYMSPDQANKHYVPVHSQELPASYTAASELPTNNGGTMWELDSTSVTPTPRQ